MKTIGTLIFTILFVLNPVVAQDTMYVYKAGALIRKQAITDIDSVTFHKDYGYPTQETVADIDGNIYHTVTIGNQTWMVENLKTTKYRNGETIPIVTDNETWANTKNGAYCFYDNDANNGITYGRLYNWYSVSDSRNIAPIGWHVPTYAEWTTLINYLTNNNYGFEGSGDDVAKSMAAKSGWAFSSTAGNVGNDPANNNSSGLKCIPGGFRYYSGAFYYVGSNGSWWSSSVSDLEKAWSCGLYYYTSNVDKNNSYKSYGLSVRCIKGESSTSVVFPTISTSAVTNITTTSATSGGNITYDGGAGVTAKGVCWNTTGSPTIEGSKSSDGTGSGSFGSNLSNLSANTLYYVRAYATNSAGTAYGAEVSFTTQQASGETVTDIDGNIYHTVKIGTQTWMVENLKTTKYRNGETITNVTDNDAWHNLTSGAYSNYNNDANNALIYGRLYNWYAVSDTRNIAPAGWHVPTDAEWTVLITYLANNGYGSWRSNSEVGKSLAATSYWALSDNGETTIGNDLTKNNKSGFTALPGGCRDDTGIFQDITYSGFWWTSSPNWNEAWYRSMYYYDGYVFKEYDYKVAGYSVRCIKDQ